MIKCFCRNCVDFTQFKTLFDHKAIYVTECRICGFVTAHYKENEDQTSEVKQT